MALYALETKGKLPMIVGGGPFPDMAATSNERLARGDGNVHELIRPIGAKVLEAAQQHDQEALVAAMTIDHLFELGLHPDTNH
jgi:hypothetical protein